MEGRFVPVDLAELVRDLFLSERTGWLELSCPGGPTLSFEFRLGMLQYGEGDEDEELGRRLVREGRISSAALAEAIAAGAAPRDLGSRLIAKGFISPETLAESFQAALTSLLCRAFRGDAGVWKFREGEVPDPVVEPDILHTVDSLFQAVAGMVGFTAVRNALLAIDRPLILRAGQGIPVERLNLTPVQGFVLSRLDGTLSMPELLAAIPPQQEEPTCRFVYALLLLGAAAYEPRLAPGAFKTSLIVAEHSRDEAREQEEEEFIRERFQTTAGASPYATLGVLEECTWEEVQAAYRARKEEIASAKFLEKVRRQHRSELRIIEGRLVQAYLAIQVVLIPGRRAEAEVPGESLDPTRAVRREVSKSEVKEQMDEAERQAESYYQKARKYYQQGDYHNCIQFGRLAITQCEPVARFHILLGEAQARNPDHRWQKLAEQSFSRAVDLDPWNADALVTLGQFYRRQGLAMRARRQFEKALELLPTHAVALEELGALKV